MNIKVYIGVIGSGKDYRSRKECHQVIAFADRLREDIWKLMNWFPETDEEYQDFKECEMLLPDNSIVSGRDLMQRYGTELRRGENDNHWVNMLTDQLAVIHMMNPNAVIGISDTRFENEVKGLIKFANKHKDQVKLEFCHCTYRSNRYNDVDPHESEKLAQRFKDFIESDEEFNKLIYSLYGKREKS